MTVSSPLTVGNLIWLLVATSCLAVTRCSLWFCQHSPGLWYSGTGLPTPAFISHRIAGVFLLSSDLRNLKKLSYSMSLGLFPHPQQLSQSSFPSLAPPPASTKGLPSACLSTSIMGQQPSPTKAALSNSPSHVSSHPPPPHYFRQPLTLLLRHPSPLLLPIPVPPTFRNPNPRRSLW